MRRSPSISLSTDGPLTGNLILNLLISSAEAGKFRACKYCLILEFFFGLAEPNVETPESGISIVAMSKASNSMRFAFAAARDSVLEALPVL